MMDTESPEEIQAKYEVLLSDYNQAKEDLKNLGHEKDIQLAISKLQMEQQQDTILQNEAQGEQWTKNQIEQFKKNILQAQQEFNDIKIKNQESLKELERKISEKKDALHPQQSQCSANLSILLENRNQLKKEEQQLKESNKQYLQSLTKLNNQKDEVDKDVENLMALVASSEQQQKKIILEVMQFRKDVEDSNNQILKLNEELSKIQRLSQENNSTSNNYQEIEKIQQNIQKINSELKKIEQQKQNLNQQLKNKERNNQKCNKKQQEMKISLQKMRDKQQKKRKNMKNLQEQKQRYEQQIKNKKERPHINYKNQTVKLKDRNQMLKNERMRILNKIDDYTEIKKSYVKQEQLIVLKEQLDKYNGMNKQIGEKIKQFKKVTEINNALKKSIDGLRKNQKKMLNEKQLMYNQTKDKYKDLMEGKTFYEKNIVHCQNKVNEYMKEYPNHQKNKIQEKQRREEERKKEAARVKLLQEQKSEKSKNQEKEDYETKDLPISPETNDSTPLLANTGIQLAGVMLIFGVVLTYLMV